MTKIKQNYNILQARYTLCYPTNSIRGLTGNLVNILNIKYHSKHTPTDTDRSSSDPFSKSQGLFACMYWLPSDEMLSTL